MSSFLSELGGMTAGVGAEGLAFAAGFAASHALQPEAALIAQDAWRAAQLRRLDPQSAALAAAEGLASEDAMANEASYSGLDASRFAYLYGVALNAPGTGELLAMLRRNDEVPIDFTHGLRKARLEPQWYDALRNLRDVRIPGPDLAYMVVRGVVPDGGTLPSRLPTHPDRLELPPQLAIDTLAEAAKTGWDAERFAALVARSGLAMAPIMAANANFRGILTDNDYLLTIARGDLFPGYADAVREVARQILTAGQYSEAELRGYSSTAERRANTRKHGMSDADSDLLHLIQGRPLAVHQVTTGLARGGLYGGKYTDVPEPYQDAIRQSNIKEPWARLAYANRYSYPSGFQIRAEAQAGRLSFDEVQQILLEIGWSPHWAQHFATAWTGGTAATSDPHITKAHNQLWTTLHRSYVAEETDDALATTTLTTLGVDGAAIPQVLALWQAERALIRKQLSAAQVKKAYATAALNPDTGSAWTQTDALDALIQRGYSMADASTLLEL